ncbi:heavy-metal-associated domain-containing protein [Flavobacteriaceae bacterium]|nr:heavy-metal-associated domain-containing protein [Flavobacteriaceae bacterium]MDB4236548.1 heavy-metal-associated domain-containing protein [Flavobacteriaceae bacterium]MDB9780617.1 heavy-metal-associated domain-containing protein [Flavobacteriaceae bacterium]MDB9798712.1 heavy-metal-associated domain-containing protein [Flavobacteriaceae bacterium]
MIRTYTINGMTCEGCVAKVTYLLEQHSNISLAKIELKNNTATLTVEKEIAIDELRRLFEAHPKYTITFSNSNEDKQNKHVFTTYKPLLLIFLFIAATTAIVSIDNGKIDVMLWMQYFMAGFFIVFSFFKFLNLTGFAESYAMYDILAKRVKAYGLVYPFIELILGVAYLTGFEPTITYIATICIMGFSSIGVIQSVLDKKKIRCACLGAVFNLPMSMVTIIENLIMVLMALIMLWKT